MPGPPPTHTGGSKTQRQMEASNNRSRVQIIFPTRERRNVFSFSECVGNGNRRGEG